jgi:DNA (cytosine-5)-methyltransferase 1
MLPREGWQGAPGQGRRVRRPTRQLELRAVFGAAPLVVNLFAGGGGTSVGIDMARGPDSVDVAINHDPRAIAMHQVNHPHAKHYLCDVWEADPVAVCGGKPVGLLWLSPDCTHHSNAKGGKPRNAKARSLASVAIPWARKVKPAVIVLENVREFLDWGPLLANGKPDPKRKGRSFRCWLGKLKARGYDVDWRILVAADYGAPTTRKRLFLIARCDGLPIVWPEPTHAKDGAGGLKPWVAASTVIDWSLPVRSIFGRKKPLAEATMRRIAEGVKRYVIESGEPFIMPLTHHDTSKRQRSLRGPDADDHRREPRRTGDRCTAADQGVWRRRQRAYQRGTRRSLASRHRHDARPPLARCRVPDEVQPEQRRTECG